MFRTLKPQGSEMERVRCIPPVRQGGGHGIVCVFWLKGTCSRHPCRFVHGEISKTRTDKKISKTRTDKKILKTRTVQKISKTRYACNLNPAKKSHVWSRAEAGATTMGTTKPYPDNNPPPEPKLSPSLCIPRHGSPRHDSPRHDSPRHDSPRAEENGTTKPSSEICDQNPQLEPKPSPSLSPRAEENRTTKPPSEISDQNSQPEPSPSLSSPSHDSEVRGTTKLISDENASSVSSAGHDREESGTTNPSPEISDEDPQCSSQLGTCNAISEDNTLQNMVLGTCTDGDKIGCSNSMFLGSGVLRLTRLDGHEKGVTGITLPPGSDKLYTGGVDGSFRVWDCHTGQCLGEFNLGSEIGCLISNGPWIYIGLRDLVKVLNFQTLTENNLDGPVGQVYALETGYNDMLFAGIPDGRILAWKHNVETNSIQPFTALKGHTSGVLSLRVINKFLYSGSMDNSIRKWDLDTLQCAETLIGHTAAVTSLLCWKNCLLSCSLDQTIKAWAVAESGCLEVVHNRDEERGAFALFGMDDEDNKSILFCSCKDGSILLYELPHFYPRGKIIGKQGVATIESGPGGLFFTGDGAGEVSVWKWASQTHTSEVEVAD